MWYCLCVYIFRVEINGFPRNFIYPEHPLNQEVSEKYL